MQCHILYITQKIYEASGIKSNIDIETLSRSFKKTEKDINMQ